LLTNSRYARRADALRLPKCFKTPSIACHSLVRLPASTPDGQGWGSAPRQGIGFAFR
jgi:hypothetical protein